LNICITKIEDLKKLLHITLLPTASKAKATTKLTASGRKKPLLPHPLLSTVGVAGGGSGGGGGVFSAAVKIFIIQT
jgi:hypothetical protein